MTAHLLRKAKADDLDLLLPLVAEYHVFESIVMSPDDRRRAVARLLDDPALGAVWFIVKDGSPIGYIALCYGYSIEFGGRDAFIDEFYILPGVRGQGFGKAAVDAVRAEAMADGVIALHLEVDHDNARARRLYEHMGFQPRTRFHLMSMSLADATELED